eukprot:1156160-Pelagomonas_calceolata.AAC.8
MASHMGHEGELENGKPHGAKGPATEGALGRVKSGAPTNSRLQGSNAQAIVLQACTCWNAESRYAQKLSMLHPLYEGVVGSLPHNKLLVVTK